MVVRSSFVILVSTALAATGCSVGYHAYPCGCVPLTYSPPAPLPYVGYDQCPTPQAVRYLGEPSPEHLPDKPGS